MPSRTQLGHLFTLVSETSLDNQAGAAEVKRGDASLAAFMPKPGVWYGHRGNQSSQPSVLMYVLQNKSQPKATASSVGGHLFGHVNSLFSS